MLYIPRMSPHALTRPWSRSAATVASRKPKAEGSIAAIFASLDANKSTDGLPERFGQLKRDIFREGLVQSWREVVAELEVVTDKVVARGSEMIPKISYADIRKGLSPEQVQAVKDVGSVIVSGAVPPEKALEWKASIRSYVEENKPRIKGFPENDVQVYELYNTKAQMAARTHPAILETQRTLLSLWHSKVSPANVSLTTPISYFDRLRIRNPGDMQFTLGPHIDGGSLERWEDPTFRSFYGRILEGGSNWRLHDPFDAGKRIGSVQDLYHTPNQCSIFRPFQGWTSISETGPGEGTLRLLPFLKLSSAYILLRPFFRPSDSGRLSDWELDLDTTSFPGARIGTTQELNPKTHPHLRLDETMVAVPKVQPGDQVYWHCDVVHAVEAAHRGKTDSSVMYIPAVPLTVENADYLRDQRVCFEKGLPPPDFPGGDGESYNTGRGAVDDIATAEGRRAVGFEPFPTNGEPLFDEVNRVLGL
ncbi:DUF1479-domain-containing protein [Hymenopellis radicata]|nr:DUF1479-domain-containing protein [Hymenopellis radicata]